METLKQQTSKNDAVVGIIDKVLNQVFGREATILIFKHLEHNYCLKRSEIGDNIELFARGLEDFLRSGAHVVEKKILEDISRDSNLLCKLQIEEVDDDVSFVTRMRVFLNKS